MKQFYRFTGSYLFFHRITAQFVFSLLLFTLSTVLAKAQVNAYARVTAIDATKTILSITSLNTTSHPGGFNGGEQVIVIQMQDNVIGSNTSNNSSFGLLGNIANAGLFEVATVSSSTPTTITLTSALQKNYSTGANSSLQVVSFRKYGGGGDYTLNSNITALAWSSTNRIGGIVAIQVDGILTLKKSITANAQGFSGGVASNDHEMGCEPAVYDTTSSNYAAKGEGIFYNYNNNVGTTSRARMLTGGGGGSDDNAGGAGGGNYTAGGDGGPGWTCTTAATAAGGLGGIALNTYIMTGNRIFMGGGGGGGQGNNTTQTDGADGGGIIIIKAAAIKTACSGSLTIAANGGNSSSTTGSGNDGAGGAGAGGTILISTNSFSVPSGCPLSIQANGGNGGNVTSTDAHGGGGGGGQGAILFSNATPTANVTTSTTSGTGGLNSSASGATRANSGTGTANSGILVGVGTVLPVQLVSLSAEKNNAQVILHWSATDEQAAVFNVQYSTNGVDFTTIGTVKGTGNGSLTTNYAFTHTNPVAGTNYYRLELTGDYLPKVTYSSIIPVNMSAAQNVTLAWPNPAHDHFTLRVNNQAGDQNLVLTITDLSGRPVYTNTYKPANNLILVTPNRQLKPGLYMTKISGNGLEQTGKLIIQ